MAKNLRVHSVKRMVGPAVDKQRYTMQTHIKRSKLIKKKQMPYLRGTCVAADQRFINLS